MDILKLLTRGGRISREYLLPGRKLFHSGSPSVTNGLLFKSSFHNRQSSLTKRAPPQMSASTFRVCLKNQSLFPDRRLMFYSTGAPSKDSSTPESANEDEAPKNSEGPAETGTDSSFSPEEKENPRKEEDDPPSSEGSSSTTSMSQTGEPLPSEQEQSEWDSKIDKLYKQIELEVLAYEPSVLDSYQWFVLTAASHLGIKVGKCWSPLKSDKMRFPLLKSAFVHKKHVVHYEIRTHHRFLTFHKLTSSTADTFLEYIQRNLPEGVGLKVTRVEAKALPHYLQRPQQQ